METQSRLLSEVYDAEKQAVLLGWGQDVEFRRMLGRIRLDALLYDKIVIPDADLFDGLFFLDAAARGRLDELPWEKIEIKSRTEQLSESFVRQVYSAAEQRHIPYYFASLPVLDRSTFSQRLGKQKNRIRAWTDIKRSLIGAGLPVEAADRYHDAWGSILNYIYRNNVTVSQWDGNFKFEEHAKIACKGVETVISDSSRDLYRRVRALGHKRSAVVATLETAKLSASAEDVRDIVTIETWYAAAYRSTQGEQHRCESVEITVPRLVRAFSENYLPTGRERLSDIEEIQMPADFLLRLGSIPKREFARLLERAEISKCIEDWKFKAQRGQLTRAIDGMLSFIEEVDGNNSMGVMSKVREGAELATVVAAGDILSERLNAALERRVFLRGVTYMGIAGAAELTVPLAEGLSKPRLARENLHAAVVRIEGHRRGALS